MRLHKILLGITLFALLAGHGDAQSLRHSVSPDVIAVVAVNPYPLIGLIVAPTLQEAKAQIHAMAFLDPICGPVPQVCEGRARDTTYFVLLAGGNFLKIQD